MCVCVCVGLPKYVSKTVFNVKVLFYTVMKIIVKFNLKNNQGM